MTRDFWVLLAAMPIAYMILFYVGNRFGPKWFIADYDRREQEMSKAFLKSEKVYEQMEETIKVLKIQVKDRDGQIDQMRHSSADRDARIAELTAKLATLESQLATETNKSAGLIKQLEDKNLIDKAPETPLLVAIGSDAALKLDLASLRAVRTDTGMAFTRIEDATLEKVKRFLDRGRINGRPYDKVHLAVHSGPEGIYLSNGLVNSVQLSEILEGVRILVLAGCEGDAVSDYLGVVPYVVSMTEKVGHGDAALFSRAFWEEIGRKTEPTEALRLAFKRAPSGMSEFVEQHW